MHLFSNLPKSEEERTQFVNLNQEIEMGPGEGGGHLRGVPSELAQPGGTRREVSGAQSEWGGRMIGKLASMGLTS